MGSVLDIIVRARDEASAVLQRVGGAVQSSAGKLAGLQSGLASVGGAMTKTLTPAAAGLAVVLGRAGNEWADARRAFATTGPELESLMRSATNVGRLVPQSLSEIAAAMSEVNDRTGLMGQPLERLTKRFLDLERITGEAASSTIPAITRLFGDWSVKTRDQKAAMDQLFTASKATGISVTQLSQLMVQFGSPLRQLGFTFDETAAMFAKFEQEGVNITTAMPGLRMALKNLSQPSDQLRKALRQVGVTAKEPKDALLQLFEVIKDMPSTADANALAFKVFGTRAGPDLAAAIREGRFDLKGLMTEIKQSPRSIKATAEETRSFGDRLAMLRNRITAVLGPFGQVGSVIAGGVASIGPFLLGLSQVIGVLGKVRLATLAAFGIWALIGVAVVAVVVLIIRNWDKVKAFLLKVWGVLKAAWSRVWEAIKAVAFRVWEAIRRPVSAFVDFVRGVISGYLGFWRRTWDAAASVVRTVWGKIKGIWQSAKGWFADLFRGIKQLAIDAWNGLVDTVKRIWNGLASLWNRGPGSWRIGFPSWMPGVGGKGWDVPDLPYLAEGGIVTRPTIAVIGEAGPEAVIPLRRAGRPPLRVDVRLVVDRRRFVEQLDVDYVWSGRW